jgi:ribosome recycling factor
VAVRNVRRDVQNELRDLEKEKEISEDELYRSEERLQKLTDEHIEAINAVSEKKEAEVLEV